MPQFEALLSAYKSRIDDAREFALKNRVLLLKTADEVAIDVSLGTLPFEEQMVSRATTFSIGPDLDIRTCSAEDLIVLKLFASRPPTSKTPRPSPSATKLSSTGSTSKNN